MTMLEFVVDEFSIDWLYNRFLKLIHGTFFGQSFHFYVPTRWFSVNRVLKKTRKVDCKLNFELYFYAFELTKVETFRKRKFVKIGDDLKEIVQKFQKQAELEKKDQSRLTHNELQIHKFDKWLIIILLYYLLM